MATTKDEIREWLKNAKEDGAAYMLVVCDKYDWEDYTVSVYPKGKREESYEFEDLKKAVKHYDGKNMQKVIEVYDLNLQFEPQLNEYRCRKDKCD